MDTIAFFSSADDAYIPKAVMALRSFQRFHPDCGYFILASKAALSRGSLELIEQFGIELLDVNEAHRFVKRGKTMDAYPPESFYIFQGPELLAKRGFKFSVSIDGDVFCCHPLELDSWIHTVAGYAGWPLNTLCDWLRIKEKTGSEEFDFTFEIIEETFGIEKDLLTSRFEVNTGVVFWNNRVMTKLELFEKASMVFAKCHGYLEGDQDLLTLAAASYNMPFIPLKSAYNFTFFEDTDIIGEEQDRRLQREVNRGEYENIHIVHFVYHKPWYPESCQTKAQVYFINVWRDFVLEALGTKASDYFGDLSTIQYSGVKYFVRCHLSIRNAIVYAMVVLGRFVLPLTVRDLLWKKIGRHLYKVDANGPGD